MWCPTSLEVNGKETKYPLPEPYLPLNFLNSTGMRYEAEEVRQCLLKGTCNEYGGGCTWTRHKVESETLGAPIIIAVIRKATTVYHFLTLWSLLSLRVPPFPLGSKESTTMSHADSLLLAELEDEIRRQVGVVYSQDCQ